MENPDSRGFSDAVYPVYFDTSLKTHMVLTIPDSHTGSDLKKMLEYEHPRFFPNIGEIKVNAIKVKQNEHFYDLWDYMLVKDAFRGVSCPWFLSIDALTVEEHRENAKSLSNINNALVLRDGDNCHAKQNSASQQFGLSNSTKEKLDDSRKEVEHLADSNSEVSFPAIDARSRPKVPSKDVGDDKICEDLPVFVATSVLKEKLKSKKRNNDAIHHDMKENGALVLSGKDAEDSANALEENLFQNGPSSGLNDVNLGDEAGIDDGEQAMDGKKKRRRQNSNPSQAGNDVAGGEASPVKMQDVSGTNRLPQSGTKSLSNINNALVLRDGDNCHAKQNSAPQQFGLSNSTKENLDDSRKEAEHLGDSNSEVSSPAIDARSRPKVQSKDVGDDKICEDLPASVATSVLKEKLKSKKRNNDAIHHDMKENGALVVLSGKDAEDSANALEENLFQNGPISGLNDVNLGDEAGINNGEQATGGKKKRRRQKSNPSQAGNDVAGGEASPVEMQDVSETNRLPQYGNEDDMDNTNDANLEIKNVAPEPAVSLVTKPIPVSQESINFRKAFGVLRHENQSDGLGEDTVEPKKSSKKVKKSRKSKGRVGGTEAVDAVHNRGPASDVSPEEQRINVNGDHLSGNGEQGGTTEGKVEAKTHVNGDHLSGNGEQGGTTEGKVEAKTQNADCSPSVTDLRADDVIQDVLESLNQCYNDQANAENTNKKSKKKSKNKSSTVVAPPESQGKDDVDHFDPTVLVHNVSEASPSSKSTRKTLKVNSSSVVQSTRVDNGNNCKEHEIAGSGETIIDKVTGKTGVETAVKGKKNLKPELQTSELLNGNKRKKSKAEAVKSSSIQSQISLSKTEPSSTNVKSSKPVLTLSESATKEPLQSNRFDKIDSTPKNAQRPIDINSSRSHTDLKKNNTRAVSSSALETPKSTINLKDGGNEQESRLDIVKATVSKVVNRNANKKSLLATTGTTFRHDDKESSDVEDGVVNSDSSAGTPSEVETAMKGKKNLKPELPSSELLNRNKHKEAKAQAVKSSSIQSQRSLSKAEPNSSDVKSSKPLLTVSKSATKEPQQSNRSGKVVSTPKNAPRPVMSSRAHTGLKKNNSSAVSSSAFETPKTTINLKKGGKERQSHLDIAKAAESNSMKVANSLANKKSLLATPGTIFRHDDKESSDDEDGVSNSDSSTRTPSDSSSSSDDSGNSHENGSYNSGAGGINKQKSGSSSPKKRLTLDAILRNSSSYKKAKLTATQDIDSQPEEFVPESQAT